MSDIPIPKGEIVLIVQQGRTPFISDKIWIEVYVASNDAWNKFLQDYPKYCFLTAYDDTSKVFYLTVNPIYNIADVIQYLAQDGIVINRSDIEIVVNSQKQH